jgi:DMSO/TMAO reductase YedYZ molybdopterin-dependent catalytic subunit
MHFQRKTLTASPENSETPLAAISGWVTPTRLFFVRNHFPVPQTDAATWELTVEGLVERPQRWSFAALAGMPQTSVFATVECAGNGRSFLAAKAEGVQWGAGAIGHAEWTGVPVRELLGAAGIKTEALEVVFEGADRGSESKDELPLPFSRSLPLEKALHPDTIIALRMNGEWLDSNHGAPMRLFVPGWYGVASVKWLQRIRIIDRAYPGYFQTTKYSIDRVVDGTKRRVPLGPGIVKSEILQPTSGAVLQPGRHRIIGLAWAGEDRVTRVEVSVDGGVSWKDASLIGLQESYSWTQWEMRWDVTACGEHTLMARAHSARGEVQPFAYNPDNLGYLINSVTPRRVTVERSAMAEKDIFVQGNWAEYMESFAETNSLRAMDVDLALTSGEGI